MLAIGGLITAPYVLPVLPVAALPTYLRLLGIREVRPETRAMGDVPQIFADMLGWEELVAEVARVYRTLPPGERERAALWGSNYGAAGAVDYFGPRYGLPKAISGVQNYYLWGPAIAVERDDRDRFRAADLSPWFDRVEPAGEVRCRTAGSPAAAHPRMPRFQDAAGPVLATGEVLDVRTGSV